LIRRTILSVPWEAWLLSIGLHGFIFGLFLWNSARMVELSPVDLQAVSDEAAASGNVLHTDEEEWRKPDTIQKMVPLAQAPPQPVPAAAPVLIPANNGSGSPAVYASASEVGQLPRFKTQVQALYPETAKRANIEGVVILQVDIDAAGEVKKVVVVQSLGYGCDEAAVAAVQQSSFSPAVTNGQPVPVRLEIPYRFKFDN
jgi:TonB family protein